MPLVLHWLDRVPPTERDRVGDKAYQLSYLAQQAYPVLPGFAIAAATLRDFLAQQGLELPVLAQLPSQQPQQLQAIARQLRQAILAAEFPADWLAALTDACTALNSPILLLRPSLSLARGTPPAHLLNAQWAWSQPAAIAAALQQVWAEVCRARSLFYWQRAGLTWAEVNLAVLVQPARDAIASGTVHRDREDWQIRAVWGLGLSWTRGEVAPDCYQIAAKSGQLQQRHLGRKSRVYRLRSAPEPALPCLEVAALDERDQQDYVLAPAQLPPLLALIERLDADLATGWSWEWLLVAAEPAPALYLTQINHRPPLAAQPADDTEPTAQLLGIGAAPGQTIAPVCLLAGASKHWQRVPPNSVLVIDRITPDWLPLLEQAAGLIVEQGGSTSHGAIVARELGIPAVVGLARATQRLHDGERILLDGTRGEVRLLAADEAIALSTTTPAPAPAPAPDAADLPALHRTQLWVNLSQPSAIAKAASLPVQAVGLLRAELMMLTLLRSHDLSWWLQHPTALSDRLAQLIQRFATAFAPRPVFYRSTDWRAPEFPLLPGTQAALNPLLGTRGTYSYQVCPELFAAELAALVQVQYACGNLNLILPFVRSVEEFASARDRVRHVGLFDTANFQLWLAAEVPSVLFLLPEYVQAGAQGIAIGSNDLAQLLLGADREDPDLSQTLADNHPVVWEAIRQLVGSARAQNIPCSLCGQAPVRWPELVDSLVRWGITAISVEPAAVPSVHATIALAEQHLRT